MMSFEYKYGRMAITEYILALYHINIYSYRNMSLNVCERGKTE